MTKPGDKNKTALLDEIIRVDHAGEYGAKRIYQGQLAVLKHRECGPEIQHMLEQELEHLAYFDDLMKEKRVRPTAMLPLWHVGSFVLGAATALMGEKAAMACTVAVESVIDGHYGEQEEVLGDQEPELRAKIAQFREEEMEHHDLGLEHGAEDAVGYPLLRGAIELITKGAIEVSKRV
jgi:ubiquinone biosynthesis monooxygenase Coq7